MGVWWVVWLWRWRELREGWVLLTLRVVEGVCLSQLRQMEHVDWKCEMLQNVGATESESLD
jgi:hypothetical protein